MSRLPTPGGDDGNWGDILNGFLNESHNADGSLKTSIVTTAIVADGAVTEAKVAGAAISSSKLADNSVITSKLVDNAVTATKIADATITTTKLLDGAITETKLASAVQTKLNAASTSLTDNDIANLLPNKASASGSALSTVIVGTAEAVDAASYGFLPTASASVNNTAIANAIASNRPVHIRGYGSANPYHISVPISLSGGGKIFYGDGANTYIVQDTDSAAIMQIGDAHNNVHDLHLAHVALPSSGQGNGIETNGLYLSHISDVEITNSNIAFYGASSFFFSNQMDSLSINGYYTSAIKHTNAGNTGSVWNNTYCNNQPNGTPLVCTGPPVDIESMNDTVFNQLNIEHTKSPGVAALFNGCHNLVINAFHIEGVSLTGYGGTYVQTYGNTNMVINGLGLEFCDIAPTGSSGGGRNWVKCGGGAKMIVNTLYGEGNTNGTSQTTTPAVTEVGNDSILWVNGGIVKDIFTGSTSGDVRGFGNPMLPKKAGALTTTELPESGMYGLDTTNHRLYVNDGGTLRYATLT